MLHVPAMMQVVFDHLVTPLPLPHALNTLRSVFSLIVQVIIPPSRP